MPVAKSVARFLFILLHGLLLAAIPCRAEPVRFGPLTMEWYDGFERKPVRGPILLVGPEEEEVSVSIFRIGDVEAPSGRVEELNRLVAFGNRHLEQQALNTGKPALALLRESLPDGSTLLSTGSESSGRDGYYLFYFLISPGGRIAYVTINGQGTTSIQNDRFRPLFQSVRWAD